jgi:predicted Zn-dependent protease
VHSDVYKGSLQRAFATPEVQAALGTEPRAKYPALGHLLHFGNSKFAEWSVPVAGSRGSGNLYGVANEIDGEWDFSRLTFESAGGKNRLNLTPIRPLNVPQAPPQRIYLVPISLDPNLSLEWAPQYYKQKFGIEVTVLPSLPQDHKLLNPARRQLNADSCVDFMQEKHPELARDPSALLIGITSHDIYIPALNWSYAENMRSEGRFAIVSSARLHPPFLLEKMNPEWLTSRLQKLLTKNIVMLYFGLPMSSDYSSLLSGGVLSGLEIDQMGGRIVGAEGRWDPFFESGGPSVTIYDTPGKSPLWRRKYADSPLPDTNGQVFSASLAVGLFVQRKMDFVFEDEPALQFSRVYRNQDGRSRAFGIGGSHSFDIFLGGQMGVAVDLITEDGSRVHFVHQPPRAGQLGDTYGVSWGAGKRFVGTEAVFLGDTWQIKTADGWTYFFPYRPQALPQYVTVLTSFIDPAHHKYEMERDSLGALLKVSSPSGKWLHFENDSEHRIHKITSSSGRSVTYDYKGGSLIRATDSQGQVDIYTYDDKGQMLTAAHGNGNPILINKYLNDGYIKCQTMSDGREFGYAYARDGNFIHENQIMDPNGLETYIQYEGNGYLESLPARPPFQRQDRCPK